MSLPFSNIIKKFYGQNRILLLLYGFIITINMTVEILFIPHIYGQIIENLSRLKKTKLNPLTKLILILILIMTLSYFTRFLMDLLDSYLVPKLQSFLRLDILSNLFKNLQTNTKNVEVGKFISNLIKIVEGIRTLVRNLKYTFIPAVFTVLLSTMYFYYQHIRIGLITTVGLMVFFVIIYKMGMRCCGKALKSENYNNKLNDFIQDIIVNLTGIFTMGKTNFELKNIKKNQKVNDKLNMDFMKCNSYLSLVFSLFYVFLILGINITSIHLFIQGKIKLAPVVSVFIISTYLIEILGYIAVDISSLTQQYGVLKEGESYFNKLLKLNQNFGKNLYKSSIQKGGIVFKDVFFKYSGSNFYSLDGVSFWIPKGKSFFLKGSIGSGKTTLVKLLLRLHDPESGNIFYNGKNIKEIPLEDLRRIISFVPQHPKLFNRSIFNNLKYGSENIPNDKVMKLMKKLKISRAFKNFDGDLNMSAGKNGDNLSGGQKQIVALVRILLRNSSVVILDEPTSSLDPQFKEMVFGLINILMKKRTVILISHDLSLTTIFKNQVRLRKGKIITKEK